MNKSSIFFIALIACLFFAPYFFKTYIIGYDSYYFLRMGWLTSNIIVAKLVLFAALASSAVIIGYLGRGINPKNGWLAGVFVFFSPIFFTEFLKFEPEAIAYPFLFASLIFFLQKKLQRKIIGIVLVLIAAFFWLPGLSWLLPTAFLFPPAIIILIPFLPAAISNYQYFLPHPGVQESFAIMQGVSFHYLLLFFGILGLVLVFRRPEWKNIKPLLPFLVVFLVMASLNGKFGVFLAPLLAVFMANAWDYFGKIREMMPILMVFCCVGLAVSVLFVYEPTDQLVENAKNAVADANEATICNSWTYGHLLEWLGGHPIAKAGGLQPDCNAQCPGCPTFFYA